MSSDSAPRAAFTHQGVTVALVRLTVGLAEELLGRNIANRRIHKVNLQRLTEALERGEWVFDGAPIRRGTDGTLLDGQHRCMAVVKTGVEVDVILIDGLHASTQSVMDSGPTRTLADMLDIRGEAQTRALAAIIRAHVTVARRGLEAAFSAGLGGAAGVPLTTSLGLAWLDANPWVRDYVRRSHGGFWPMSGTSAAILMHAFDELDAEDSSYFWLRLQDGAGLDVDSPIRFLRETLIRKHEDLHSKRDQRFYAAITIKAWNAYREGRSISQLRFRLGGAAPESFPEPK